MTLEHYGQETATVHVCQSYVTISVPYVAILLFLLAMPYCISCTSLSS